MSEDRVPFGATTAPRIDNTPEGHEHCRFCCGNAPGMVVVGTEHTDTKSPHVSGGACLGCTEQYGPCPACELGKQFEFSKAGMRQWGRDGFWKGLEKQALTQLPTTCTCKETILPSRENAARARELAKALTEALAEKTADPVQKDPVPVRQPETPATDNQIML